MDFNLEKELSAIRGKKPEDLAKRELIQLLLDIQTLSKKVERIKDSDKLHTFLDNCLTSTSRPIVFQTALDVADRAQSALTLVHTVREAQKKAEERKDKPKDPVEPKKGGAKTKGTEEGKKEGQKAPEVKKQAESTHVTVIVHVGGRDIPVSVEKPPVEKAPKKGKTPIPSALRTQVWDRYIGEEVGRCKCYCCRTNFITQRKFEAGHVLSEKKGGPTTIENLRPICSGCNKSMGAMHMADYCKQYYKRILDD
jgi:hypothetical protein